MSQGLDIAEDRASGLLGSFVWASARLLCDFLTLHSASLVRGKRVLELGSGPGLCGLECGRLGAAAVMLTDLPEVGVVCAPVLRRTHAECLTS
jgi:predicted nicotinamide N-methyase